MDGTLTSTGMQGRGATYSLKSVNAVRIDGVWHAEVEVGGPSGASTGSAEHDGCYDAIAWAVVLATMPEAEVKCAGVTDQSGRYGAVAAVLRGRVQEVGVCDHHDPRMAVGLAVTDAVNKHAANSRHTTRDEV